MLKKTLVILIDIFFFSTLLFSKDIDSVIYKREISPWRIQDNYCLSLYNRNIAAVFFSGNSSLICDVKNSFLLRETVESSLASTIVYHSDLFSMAVSQSGYSKFGELRVSAGYARRFARRFVAGLRFHYFLNYALHYEKVHSVTFDVSFFSQLTDKVGFGITVCNPARLKYGMKRKRNMYMPVLFRVDFYYCIHDKFLINSGIEKELSSYVNVYLGLLYRLNRHLYTGLAFNVPNFSVTLITRMWWRSFQFGFHSDFHCKLGVSPHVTFTYLF